MTKQQQQLLPRFVCYINFNFLFAWLLAKAKAKGKAKPKVSKATRTQNSDFSSDCNAKPQSDSCSFSILGAWATIVADLTQNAANLLLEPNWANGAAAMDICQCPWQTILAQLLALHLALSVSVCAHCSIGLLVKSAWQCL